MIISFDKIERAIRFGKKGFDVYLEERLLLRVENSHTSFYPVKWDVGNVLLKLPFLSPNLIGYNFSLKGDSSFDWNKCHRVQEGEWIFDGLFRIKKNSAVGGYTIFYSDWRIPIRNVNGLPDIQVSQQLISSDIQNVVKFRV